MSTTRSRRTGWLVTLNRAAWSDGPRPLAVAPGLSLARAALAHLAIAWTEVVLTGQIDRLKRCAEHTCGWVFWDASKNHSRRWCSMRVCGNRTKSRRYATRRRDTTG
jgi:predicted RNA-binding Zn ribbon-like protein